MRTIAITGSAGGIGGALRARLEGQGDQVIGIDVRDAEVIADLATADGRAAMVAAVTERSGGALDGVVAAAGVTHDDGALVTSINYFGAIATLEGLRSLLVGRPGASAVAVASNSATTQPALRLEHVEACLAGDEAAAAGRRRTRRRGLRRQQARAGPMGAPPRDHGRLDRRRGAPERHRARVHRHADDRGLPGLHPRPGRRLPDPDRARRRGLRGGGPPRLPPVGRRRLLLRLGASRWTAAPRPPCAPTTGPDASADHPG